MERASEQPLPSHTVRLPTPFTHSFSNARESSVLFLDPNVHNDETRMYSSSIPVSTRERAYCQIGVAGTLVMLVHLLIVS